MSAITGFTDEIQGAVVATELIALEGKYTFPLDAPPGPNQVIKSDGTEQLQWGPDASNVGDVVGPASATNNAIVAWDGTTGKLLKDSGVNVGTILTNPLFADLDLANNNITNVNDIEATTATLGDIVANDLVLDTLLDVNQSIKWNENSNTQYELIHIANAGNQLDLIDTSSGENVFRVTPGGGGGIPDISFTAGVGCQNNLSISRDNNDANLSFNTTNVLGWSLRNKDNDKSLKIINSTTVDDYDVITFNKIGLSDAEIVMNTDLKLDTNDISGVGRLTTDDISVNTAINVGPSDPNFGTVIGDRYQSIIHSEDIAGGAGLRPLRSRGTRSVPTAVQAGDDIMELDYRAHDGVAYYQGAAIQVDANENWDAANHGTIIRLRATDNGSTAVSTKMIIGGDITIYNSDLKLNANDISGVGILSGSDLVATSTISSVRCNIANSGFVNKWGLQTVAISESLDFRGVGDVSVATLSQGGIFTNGGVIINDPTTAGLEFRNASSTNFIFEAAGDVLTLKEGDLGNAVMTFTKDGLGDSATEIHGEVLIEPRSGVVTCLDVKDDGGDSILKVNNDGTVDIGITPTAYTLPTARGTVDQIIQTDGVGVTSWQSLPTTSYSETYFKGNATDTVLALADTYYAIVGVRNSGMNLDFTPSGTISTYNGTDTKTFKTDVHVGWEAAGAANDIYSLSIFKNGVLVASSENRGSLDNSSVWPRNASCACIMSLATNDTVEARVQNIGDDQDVLIIDFNLLITQA